MTPLFPGQRADERICLVIRQHWFTFAAKLIIWLVFAGTLAFVHFAVRAYFPSLLTEPYNHLLNLAELIYLMFLVLGLFITWILYYLNMEIITDKRIVDITQKSLMQHTLSELNLNRVQDVTAQVRGLTETFLNFGDVHLQTAGETERFVFEKIPDPTSVAKLILDLYEALPPEEKAKGHD